MLEGLTFRVDRLQAAAGAFYSTATDLADYLVRKGLPFREAHELAGRTVRYGLEQKKELGELTLAELERFSPLIGADVHAALTAEASLRTRPASGRTAPAAVACAPAHVRPPLGRRG